MDKKIEILQEKLAALIDFYENKNLQSLSYHDCFKKTVEILDRAKREFDAGLFFILMFGPLKAGKSTLTNLLAREYVSPTGFGIETTLRPSLIMKSRTKDYVIDVYESVNTKDDQEEMFHLVMDVLRGILDYKAIKSKIRKITIPLTKKNVEKQLICHLDNEPLVTVLNVPGGNLVTEHIALIDMPGLDGIQSNWQDSVIHKWILKRADFLIFIQSSMAALNKATFDFLQDAYLSSRKPPLWLVQNIIDAKYWRSDEERRSDNDTQRQNAKGHISNLLGISEDLRSTAINLGKASDGMDMENFHSLMSESGFPEFECSLKDILQKSRVRIQQENSVKGVLNAMHNCEQEFDRYKEEIRRLQTEYDAQIQKLTKPQNILYTMCKTIRPDAVKRSLEIALKETIDAWKSVCYSHIDRDRLSAGLNSARLKDELQKRADKLEDDINNSRREDYMEDSSPFKQNINNLAAEYIQDLQGDYLQELNDCLQELNIKPYEQEFYFAPKLDIHDFKISDNVSGILKKTTSLGVKMSGKKEEKINKVIGGFCDACRHELNEYADGLLKIMLTEISGDFDVWIQRSYRDVLSSYISEQIDDRKQELLLEIDKIEDTLAYMKQLETMFDELTDFIHQNIEL